MATDASWSEYPAWQTLTLTISDQVLLADAFDALDRTKWPGGTFTSTADTTVPVAANGGALQIGPMLASTTGSHYNGVNTAAFDFTANGAASVQLTQTGNGLAYAMFAAGSDGSNYYRWYVSGGQIVALPDELAVGADYGLTVIANAPPDAYRLAMSILTADGQRVLAKYGFSAPALPQ